MFRFLCVCWALLLAVAVQAAPYRIAVFGDSLSAGYHLSEKDAFYSQLQRALSEKGYSVQVIHASKSGETTTGGLKRQQELLSQNPDAVLLELGINDVFKNYDLSVTEKNLETMIHRFQNQNIPVLLIGMKAPLQYSNREAFERMYQNLASRNNLFFYPFYMEGIFTRETLETLSSPYLLPDHIHPNAEGVRIMVRGILPLVEKFLRAEGISPLK